MEHAAEIHHNLDAVLGPKFELFSTGIEDLKGTITELRQTVELLRDTVVLSTSDIKNIKEKQDAQESRIAVIENTMGEHKLVAADYKRSKAVCIWCIGLGATILSTVVGCLLSDYLESKRHAEDMAYKQAIHESYTKLSKTVETLAKKVEGK